MTNPFTRAVCDAGSFFSFPSPRLVAILKLKRPVCPTIGPLLEREQLDSYLSQVYRCYVKCNQHHPGFELVSLRPFPMMITITTWAPPFSLSIYISIHITITPWTPISDKVEKYLWSKWPNSSISNNSIWMSNNSIWPIDRTLSVTTTPDQMGPGSDDNEQILCIPSTFNITGASPSDYLMSYPGHLLGDSYPLQRCSQCILHPQSSGLFIIIFCPVIYRSK